MAKFFLILAVSGLATLVVSGAGDKKGAAVKTNGATAFCEPDISFSAGESESDCSEKCNKDSNCRFAVYQGKEKKCGLAPASAECTFGTSELEDILLGFSYKTFTEQNVWQFNFGFSHPLQTKSGAEVLASASGVSTDACRKLCNIHSQCQIAFYEARMGMNSCTLMEKSGAGVEKVGPDYHGIATVYTAA